MSDWWYPGQLARQDEYGQLVPPDEAGLQPQKATIGPAEMRSYTPTLGERLKGGLSDLFRSGGADSYNAGKLGDIAATGLSLLPPVGYSVAKSEMEHGVEGRNPTGIALGALGAIPGAKGVMGELASPFYSAAGRAVENAKLGKGTGEQWLGYLRNQPGVKPEELQYVFGNLPEGQLTKAQMQAHAAENAVTLGEKSLGDNTQLQMRLAQDVIKEKAQLQRLGNEWDAAQPSARTQIETEMNLRHDRIRELENESRGLPERNSKYDQWQLPGGENYRETLLTLPDKTSYDVLHRGLEEKYGANWMRHATPEEIKKLEYTKDTNFKSSHWDEPNVLAHVRTNDREIPGVGKSLHVEEIQSDWHQKGRAGGYNNAERAAEIDGIKQQLTKLTDEWDTLGATSPRRGTISEEMNVLNDKLRAMNSDSPGVPDAPFKSTWADVALKRQIREASEKGYDAISWTPGEAQAARYDLSKHVKEIEYIKRGDKYELGVTDIRGDGVDMPNKAMTLKEIEDTLGKEMAEKISKGEGQKFRGHEGYTLSGLDLKVGGEGMRAFYDKMLVDKANALGKKHGARVEPSSVPTNKEGWHITSPEQTTHGKWMVKSSDYNSIGLRFDTEAEAKAALAEKIKKDPVHVLRITPELRAAAMKGFPLFTAGGVAVTGAMGELARQDKYGRNE